MKHLQALSLSMLLLTTAALRPASAQVVGFWQFNEKLPGNVSDTAVNSILDASGNGRHGTTTLPLNYTAGNPAYGSSSALTFTLSTDNVTVPDSAGVFNFTPAQSMTFEALIRTYNIGQDGVGAIMNKQGANPGEWWWRINNTGKQQFWINDGVGSAHNVSGSKVLNDGQWHHVAAVYDATAQRVRVYVDYALDGSADATFTTAGTIGNTQDLWIGAFQNGTRQFDGDMDFARVSAGALTPADFVQPATSLASFSPTNDASYLPAGTVASFTVKSPTVGVAASNIVVLVNGVNITSQLSLAGSDNERTVTLPALSANTFYNVTITIKDLSGYQFSQGWIFNTFAADCFSIEAEDYNFGGGQYIDNPQLTSVPGPNNYLDRLATEGIDVHQTNTPTLVQYRIGDVAGTAVCPDPLRQAYLTAQVTDPGVADYMLRDNANTEWLNYTRTFPAGTYRIYARLAKPGTVPVVMQLDEVTSGSATSSQTLAPLGTFRRAPTGSDTDYEFVALTDALGNEVGVSLNGVQTLRLTFVSGGANVSLNYLVFVPCSTAQAPFIAVAAPASGAGNEAPNATIQAQLRNADTAVVANTIQLKLDGTAVTPAISSTGIGANVTYTPSVMSTGLHTATLIFTDSAARSVTNQWQFYVANRAVRGYWKFNEQAAGTYASTSAGAILDASGNARHGTANVPILYVGGSFNYSNTPALRFTAGPDRVVIPDPAGNFTFTNSFTFEAIVRTTNGASTSGALLAKNGLGDGEGEFWWRFPGTASGQQRVGMNNQLFLTGTKALNDGAWHHLAVVYDQPNNQVRLYADYALEVTATNLFDRPIGRPADLYIGSFIGGGSDWDGDIDTLRISDGALTTAQFIQTTVALQPVVKTLRPANGARNVSPTTLIGAELLNRDTAVVLSTLKLFIDGNDVTAGAIKTATATNTVKIDYLPNTPLANGPHVAKITFSDTAVPANLWTNTWTFTNLANLPVLAFYQFNEQAPGNPGSTATNAFVDSSGLGHPATMIVTNSPAVPLDYVAGSPNYGSSSALEFSTNRAVRLVVPDPTGVFNFWNTQSITMEAVIKTVNIGQSGVGCILAKQTASPGEWYWRISATGFQRWSATDGSGLKTANGTKAVNDGQWHHIAAVYDAVAKQLRVYLDYALESSVATTFSSTTSPIGNPLDLWIGQQQSGTSKFDGDIDMIRVSGEALDPSWFIPLGGVATPVKLFGVAVSGGSFAFSYETELGRSYTIQAAPSLGAGWTDVETVTGTGATKSASYSITGTQKYFRIRVQ